MYTVEQFYGGNGSPDADQDGRPIIDGAYYVVEYSKDGGMVVDGPYHYRNSAARSADLFHCAQQVSR